MGHLRRSHFKAYNTIILCWVCLGSVAYGYAGSIIGTTLGQPSFIEYMKLDSRANADQLIGAMNSLYQAGGFIGTMLLPIFSDTWGRKAGILASALLLILGGAGMAGSTHIAMFIVFRFISGAGAFMILAAVPIWINEIVPPDARGALVDFHGVFLSFGSVTASWIGVGFYFYTSGNGNEFRPPLAFQCIFPIILIAGLWWIPESPRWLVMKGRDSEALTILKKLHLLESDTNDVAARAELVQIHAQMEVDKLYGSSWLQIARKKTYLKRFALAAGTAGILQCCGQQVITSYGPSLYGNLGYGPLPQLCFQAGYISTGAVTQILSVLVVDLFSRPKFMATGVFACMGTLVGEAIVVARYVGTDNTNALQAGVAMLFLFLGFYSFFLDGTQFSYIGEIFPTGLRAKGLSVGVATICLVNIIWLQAAPAGLRHIGWKFYLVFICTSATGAIIMWMFFPDTLGIPLEEMSAIFEGEDSVVSPEKALEIAEQMEDTEVTVPNRNDVKASV